MPQITNPKKWTTDELLGILSYIESHPFDSLSEACRKAIKHQNIDRTHKSTYSKMTRLIYAIKLWLNDHIQNGEAIIWKDDRVYKLLEKICETRESNKNNKNQEQELQRGDQIESTIETNSVIDKSEEQDLTDNFSDSTMDGDYYTDHLDLYRKNKEQFPSFHLPLKILSDRIYEAEKEAREVYETTTAENEDMNYHQICQIIKQIQEYRDEVCGLFEEFEKKINEMRSL
ncbi:uncharacterized protein OCT59_025943 [Rhizophagus irregularis]|uniref:Uncharacterized protein n=2 Tax=Rhizophagus irregularis TaxID=588596 RepID=A0A916E205_9GLOM|nr:hypothetical protein RirG_093470 [Rhizophagus irregularis DAOM 197198w]UZO05599.1 hypothetical protein OCT59_025943 [Rhizophagus irregularis]GBC12353.1 hypothetical protein GLOIN_2v1471659 [Rhizophagus irregularis DAOM 181602=DAOM 197198]CAB4478834.1 unnamed protein product [Rhizophagus irregularis]CAB5350166.1 unnamed protein product [Rhizophagus irregularis]